MNLRILPEAQGEALEAATWYERQRGSLGEEFLSELESALTTLRHAPDAGSRMEGYSGRFDVRRVLLHRFPYAVIVVCRSDETVVVAVAHTRRRPLFWLNRVT